MKTTADPSHDLLSLDKLEVDWDYEPENPLGKRLRARFAPADFKALFDTGMILVKIAGRHLSTRGNLLDISHGGLAVLLDMPVAAGQMIKANLLLGRRKIVSTAVVRNCIPFSGGHRVGMEFLDLDEECSAYIAGFSAAQTYTI